MEKPELGVIRKTGRPETGNKRRERKNESRFPAAKGAVAAEEKEVATVQQQQQRQ